MKLVSFDKLDAQAHGWRAEFRQGDSQSVPECCRARKLLAQNRSEEQARLTQRRAPTSRAQKAYFVVDRDAKQILAKK